jgi:glycosyltransferase involved in cell wall biosynthesis
MLNAVNSPLAFIPRLTGKKVVMNVDGIERLRKKWNWLGKFYYRVGEYLATKFPNVIVSDARVIEEYYCQKYKKNSVMIPYGADIDKADSDNILKKFNLRSRDYILYISRLEPENNAHIVINAFKKVKTEKSLVIVGDAPYAQKYKQEIRNLAGDDPRVVFTGFVFGKGYKELQSHAYCYVQATEVGGTHPALVEAMGFGNSVIVNGTPENIEVVGEAGIIYRKNDIEDLKEKLQYLIDNSNIVHAYGEKARERVNQFYNWEEITNKYISLFAHLIENY